MTTFRFVSRGLAKFPYERELGRRCRSQCIPPPSSSDPRVHPRPPQPSHDFPFIYTHPFTISVHIVHPHVSGLPVASFVGYPCRNASESDGSRASRVTRNPRPRNTSPRLFPRRRRRHESDRSRNFRRPYSQEKAFNCATVDYVIKL